MTEKAVIEDVLSGKKESFATLVKDNNQLLYRVGMSYLKDHAEVEDIMQVTYLKAFDNIGRFNHQSSFSTWITRIMINECLMYLRKRKRRFEFASGDIYSSGAFEIQDSTSIESVLTNQEIKAIAEKMLLKLPEAYRVVFILREVQELSAKEVAEALGVTEENVNVRLHRGKKLLQKSIIEYAGDPDIFSYHKKYCSVLTANVMDRLLLLN